MSRIGRLPVAIPAGVEVSVAAGNVVTVKGPKGTLERALPTEMEIKVEDGHVAVSYTHLDVYKRQLQDLKHAQLRSWFRLPVSLTVRSTLRLEEKKSMQKVSWE